MIPEGVDECGGGLEREPVVCYETDEDEFLENLDRNTAVATTFEQALLLRKVPLKSKKTTKRDVKAPRKCESGYDLAYFKLWWARMGIEGRKQAKEKLRQEDKLKGTKEARRMYVNIRREPQTDCMKEMASSTSQDQFENPRLQQSLGEGDILKGECTFVGEGRGSPVFDASVEQPQEIEPENMYQLDTGDVLNDEEG